MTNISNLVLNETELGHLFLSIFSLLIGAHFFGCLFNKFRLPRVIGEIFSGIFLGPSLLAFIFPKYYESLFNMFPAQGKILSFIYWIGLFLLMLSAGFKIDHKSISKDYKIIINLIIFSTLFPIIGGIIYCNLYDFNFFKGTAGTNLSMSIIICISIAITSIPVISKIFLDLNIIQSRFAKIILTTSTLHDLILWVVLDIAIKSSTVEKSAILFVPLVTLLFLGFFLLISPYVIKFLKRLDENLLSNSSAVGYVLGISFLIVILANSLGINIIFGALVAGIVIGLFPNKSFQAARNVITEFSLAFFIPLYFAIVGLKINLPAYFDLTLFLSFFAISSLLEIGSVFIGLKFLKKDWLTSLNFGFAMNTRGGPGIVVASIAYEFSIINEVLFVVLVVTAIATSLISGAWFRFILQRGWPLYE